MSPTLSDLITKVNVWNVEPSANLYVRRAPASHWPALLLLYECVFAWFARSRAARKLAAAAAAGHAIPGQSNGCVARLNSSDV
jgi:hypothetical protein